MQPVKKIICPLCGSRFASDDPVIGDILRCPFCTLDLKVIGRDPVTVVVDDSWENDLANLSLENRKLSGLNRSLKKEEVWED